MRISPMTSNDFEFAVSLTDNEGWGNVPVDFERLVSLDSKGCFIARAENESVGMITTTSGDDYGFIGSLIVRSSYRRRGIGEALMTHAISYLRDNSISCIELDATFQGVPLYRKLGFRDKYLSMRFVRPATAEKDHSPPNSDFKLEEILALDKRFTGLNRSAILTRLANEFGDSVFTMRGDHLQGYAIAYPRGDIRAIGPIVADSMDIAKAILDKIVKRHSSQALSIGLPEAAHLFTPTLLEHQFEYREPSLRMYLGQRRDFESSIYGIISPEKG